MRWTSALVAVAATLPTSSCAVAPGAPEPAVAPGAPQDAVVRTPGGALVKTLPNGLRVVVIENHAAPLAIINTWFTVGARNEARTEQGMSHFLEHMLFDGSEGMTLDDYNRFILTHAAFDNASTDVDNTNYWQLAPVRHFPELLKLNRTLVSKPLLLDEQFGREREVVKEELRQDLDDPSYFVSDLVLPKAFAHTGYDHPVIGDAANLDGQQNEWMRAYYHRYYGPNNAFVLAIGDFDAAKALVQIEEAYGDWKPVTVAPAPEIRPFDQKAPQSLVGCRSFAANHVLFAWPTVKCGSPEAYALDVLATILGGGESSRLAKGLKRTRGLVTSVSASTSDRVDQSAFVIEAEVAEPSKSNETAEAVLDVVAKLKADGPSAAELDRAKRSLALGRVFLGENLQQQAYQTGYYLVASGGPQYLESYADRVYGVTAADVQWAAREFLVAEHLTLGLATGDEKATALAPDWKRLGSDAAGPRPEGLGRAATNPFAATSATSNAAATERLAGLVRFKMPNGMETLILRAPSRGTVGVSLAARGGLGLETWDTNGVATLATRALSRRSARRTGDEIAAEMDALGARWSGDAGPDFIELRSLYASADLARGLDFIADLVGGATYPDTDVASERDLLVSSIASRADDSYDSTHDQLAFAMFGKDSAYGRPPLGRPSVVAALTPEQVRAFHRKAFAPSNLVLAIVGDLDPTLTKAAVEKAFGALVAPAAEEPSVKSEAKHPLGAVAPEGFTRIVVNVDKAQTMSVLGIPGPSLSDPEMPAVRLVNLVLGGTWLGRLFDHLRTKEGLCYGSYSNVESNRDGGAIVARIGTRPEMWDAAVSGLRREFKSIADAGISQQEMTEAVNFWKGDSDRRHAGMQSQASFLAKNVALGLAPGHEDDELLAMTRLDLAAVNAVAKRRFAAEKAWLAVTGPIYKAPAELK